MNELCQEGGMTHANFTAPTGMANVSTLILHALARFIRPVRLSALTLGCVVAC